MNFFFFVQKEEHVRICVISTHRMDSMARSRSRLEINLSGSGDRVSGTVTIKVIVN